MITETWLPPNISDGELGLVGFQIFILDKNSDNSYFSREGGVLIAIKFSLKSYPIPSTISNVEQLFAILFLNTSNLIVGDVYLPPHSSFSLIESHLSSV